MATSPSGARSRARPCAARRPPTASTPCASKPTGRPPSSAAGAWTGSGTRRAARGSRAPTSYAQAPPFAWNTTLNFSEAAAQDIPQFVEQDSFFLDLLDNEKTTELLAQLIGEGSGSYIYSSADQIQVAHIQARTVPLERDGGYTSWHRVSLNRLL